MEVNPTQAFVKSLGAVVSAKAEVTSAVVKNNPEQPTTLVKVTEVTPELLEQQAKLTNNAFEQSGQNLSFSFDETAKSSIIKLFDRDTGDLIRQFPSASALEMMKNIQNHLEMINQELPKEKDSLTGSLINDVR